MQIRDYISHDWQTVGAIQAALYRAGIPISEVALLRLLRSMQGIAERDGLFRQVLP